MKDIGIGLLGFGTVGCGVVRALLDNGPLLARRIGARPVLRKIADLDLDRDRGVAVDRSMLTRDAAAVIRDPEVDIVIELVGGTTVARELIRQALEAGKPVVTANKALLAAHGESLFRLAAEKNVDLCFGASVGGGIPVIRTLREGLVANRIQGIYAILNGTCNYIISRMEDDDMPFDEALKEAQAQGFAEADPSLDIDGHDTAHKAILLAALAYGVAPPLERVPTDGIRGLSAVDIRYALDLGYRIKLLAVVRDADGALEVSVQPTLVPMSNPLAAVCGVYNGVLIEADQVGRTLLCGRGAGAGPTASTVLADVADVARNLMVGAPGRIPAILEASSPMALSEPGAVVARHYIRVTLADEAGALANVSATLSRRGISIASALQTENEENGDVPVVLLTHEARKEEVTAAVRDVCAMDRVRRGPVVLRVLT